MAVKIFISRVIAEERINGLLPLFRRLRNLATNQPGYISGETLKRIDSPGKYLVISTWDSLDDWRRWVVSRERIEVQNEIDARMDEETVKELDRILDADCHKANINDVTAEARHLTPEEQKQLNFLLKRHEDLFDG